MDDPFDRGASAKNPALLAPALQSRPTTLFFGAGPARSAAKFPRAFATPETSFRPIKPSCGAPGPERASPRVQPLGSRCMKVVEFLRTTVGPIRPRRPRQRPCEISEASRMQKSGNGHPLGAQARPPFAAKRQGFCRPRLHLNTLAASRSRNRAK